MEEFRKALRGFLQSWGIIEKGAKQEEMISYEVVYEPDTKDAHGNWMSKDTLVKACKDFNEHLASGDVHPNLFHLQNTDTFSIEDTWIHKEFDVVVASTEQPIKAGTWVSKLKYHDSQLWELKKTGVIGGVSIQCKGTIDKETGEILDVSFADMDIENKNTSGGKE